MFFQCWIKGAKIHSRNETWLYEEWLSLFLFWFFRGKKKLINLPVTNKLTVSDWNKLTKIQTRNSSGNISSAEGKLT